MQTAVHQSESVADRVQALLNRVAGVRRGSECDRPTKFDRRGQSHAREVARRDAQSTPKPVDTALGKTTAAGDRTATAALSSLPGPLAEPVTGASTRLSTGEAR